jgi:ParB family chromosome partitioning protein
MHIILTLPTAEIQADALLRDRITLDDAALEDLAASIATDGLRQPIEVWALHAPTETHRYGLISGLRRLTAMRLLATRRGNGDFTTIPAFLRTPADLPDAMAQMIAENEIRENLSPWERGATIAAAVDAGLFDTMDQAVAALHPTATRQKRSRLRTLAMVVEATDGLFTTPEQLTLAQMERVATCLRGGLAPLIDQILTEHRRESLPSQWAALLPTLTEALSAETDPTSTQPGRPRRMLHLKQGLTIRREQCRHGWLLRFSGPEARKGGLVDDVMDHVERLFQKWE